MSKMPISQKINKHTVKKTVKKTRGGTSLVHVDGLVTTIAPNGGKVVYRANNIRDRNYRKIIILLGIVAVAVLGGTFLFRILYMK